MTEYLDPEDAESIIEQEGWKIRDRNLLLSALAAPMPVFGEEVYPRLHQKAVVLLHALNHNHPLFDGNKRLSWLLTAIFLEINGEDVTPPQYDIVDFVVGIAAGEIEQADTERWIDLHARPI